MSSIKLDESYKYQLLRSYPIDPDLLESLLDELGEYFSRNPEDFIGQRHRQLQREGLKNPGIFTRIQEELKTMRFMSPDYSIRQIRRIIYG